MNEDKNNELNRFLDRLRSDELSREELTEWEERLTEEPDLRREFRSRLRMEAHLLAAFRSAESEIVPPLMTRSPGHTGSSWWLAAASLGMAASLAVAVIAVLRGREPASAPTIAVIESADEAAWVSSQPTALGSRLSAGEVELKSGVAELRFQSGALVALEAPVRFEIIDPMHCRLLEGTAVVEVPEPAKGFVMETPGGRAVDHGTRFAVRVARGSQSADFEVLDGEISLHHSESGTALPLKEAEAARLSDAGIEELESRPSQEMSTGSGPGWRRLRIEQGREASIVRFQWGNWREKYLHPDFLMVKEDLERHEWKGDTPPNFGRDRRSLIAFSLGDMEPGKVQRARLQLNLVPTGLGFVSALPEVSNFEVYGIRDDAALENWSAEELRWEEAPGSLGLHKGVDGSEVRRLGSFDLPKGKISGSILFESPELTEFVRDDTTGEVGFLLLRTTPPLDSWSLVHAFASSSHPDVAGPSLELKLADPGSE